MCVFNRNLIAKYNFIWVHFFYNFFHLFYIWLNFFTIIPKRNMASIDNNPLKNQADEYLRKHRIIELFEDLCSDLSYEQPQNIN